MLDCSKTSVENTSFSNHVAYVTHSAAEPESENTGGSLSDYMDLLLDQKPLCLFFFFYM